MSGNTVYSDYKIIDLDEYKKSSIHQKKLQELNIKKHNKKKKTIKVSTNNKNIRPGEARSNIGIFVAVIAMAFIMCLIIAYFVNSNNSIKKAETSVISYTIKV